MDIWNLIKQHQGEEFRTVRGLSFSYIIDGEKLRHTRCKNPINRNDFEKAIIIAPQKPSDLHNEVIGPSYVYAIISDPRMK